MSTLELSVDAALDDDAEAAPVVVFHRGGAGAPLVFVRAWIGLQGHQRLAAALGPDQPVYAIAPPTGARVSDFPDTVDAWVAWSLDRIHGVLPGCGVVLAGTSFGGVIALEMARRLAREGRPIDRVLMIDTWRPQRAPRQGRHLPHRVLYHLSRSLDQPPGQRLGYLRAQAGVMTRALTQRVRPKREEAGHLAGEKIVTSTGREMPMLTRAVWVAYVKYRPEPFTLPVSLYWSEGSRRRKGDTGLGWTPWLRGPLEIQPVDGDHTTLMSAAHAPALAAHIARSLRR